MKKQRMLAALAAIFLTAACKQAPSDANNGGPHSGSNIDCVTDIRQAMDQYYDLIQDDNPDNDPAAPPVECDLPAPSGYPELTINATLLDFSPAQEEKMREALRRAQIVINSEEFRQRVLNYTWNGKKQFHDNRGHSNAQIYEVIMAGAEDLKPEPDSVMDLDLTLYYSNNSTVGYTYPNTMRIWVNNKFFSNYNYGQVAANAVHEWTHKLGYDHDFYNNSSRPHSVPYAIGSIINELVNKL